MTSQSLVPYRDVPLLEFRDDAPNRLDATAIANFWQYEVEDVADLLEKERTQQFELQLNRPERSYLYEDIVLKYSSIRHEGVRVRKVNANVSQLAWQYRRQAISVLIRASDLRRTTIHAFTAFLTSVLASMLLGGLALVKGSAGLAEAALVMAGVFCLLGSYTADRVQREAGGKRGRFTDHH